MSTPAAVYRSLIRQANKASIHPPTQRNLGLQSHLRQLVVSLPPASDPSFAQAAAELQEVAKFMESQRLHAELLERYNPTHGMTTQERNHLTARRVGLNLPKDIDMTKDVNASSPSKE